MKLMAKNKIDFYSNEEIKKLLENKVRLVYVDNGIDEVVARYEDIPDIIVDINAKFGTMNLKVYDFENCNMDNPLLTTFGSFLNKCDEMVRADIFDRLVSLQVGNSQIKKYKLIDERMLDRIIDSQEIER